MIKAIGLVILLMTSASAYSHEETILCWDKGRVQTEQNAIIILGSGAQYYDIDKINLEEINVLIEGRGTRRGNCTSKWYEGGSKYKCQEYVTVERIYYSTAFSMSLTMESFKVSQDGTVLLLGHLKAKRTHDEFNGPVLDKVEKELFCKHRAE